MKTLDKPCIPLFASDKTITILYIRLIQKKCSPMPMLTYYCTKNLHSHSLHFFLFYYETIPML